MLGSGASAGGLLEAIAVAIHGQDADVVSEPVEQRAGQPLRSQNLRPVLEWQIGGDVGELETTVVIQIFQRSVAENICWR